MEAAKVENLRRSMERCNADPCILTDNLTYTFPLSTPKSTVETEEKLEEEEEEEEDEEEDEEEELEEIVESDVEVEGEVVEPDGDDPSQKMGDYPAEVTKEGREAAQEAKAKAMEAVSQGKLEEAVELLTEAVLLYPSSIMYATRASVYNKMKKPNAAIRDANAALEVNPDSAKGYKARGMARALLGQWEGALKDLQAASKLDYDEEINAVLKKVEANALRLKEHRAKYERLLKEREERERGSAKAQTNAPVSLTPPPETNPKQPQPSMAFQLPSDTGSSSTGNASVVLGQPQPFNGNNAFKKGERLKYTKVELPGFFKRDVKLWVKYGELYLMAMEMKPKSFGSSNCRDAMKSHYYNHGPSASMYNGSFFLSLARRENATPGGRGRHPNPSGEDEKDTLYSKVELPGVYGEGVKMWVKSESIVVNSMNIKTEDACSMQEEKPKLRIGKDGAEIDSSLAVTLVFAPKVRE
ncbi:hypothetical protein Tsubulata_036344 [Turnera subulata]|uniref:Uncharacterized protein n=1 Tax=Turnera subulata TaxID=218843 RepID=A0A9Q0FND2_9ROSI|nr:hypothetical protein Tsubulata_036344 [Turnera subulata]